MSPIELKTKVFHCKNVVVPHLEPQPQKLQACLNMLRCAITLLLMQDGGSRWLCEWAIFVTVVVRTLNNLLWTHYASEEYAFMIHFLVGGTWRLLIVLLLNWPTLSPILNCEEIWRSPWTMMQMIAPSIIAPSWNKHIIQRGRRPNLVIVPKKNLQVLQLRPHLASVKPV